MYAIVQNGSHQYKVTPGMELSFYNLSKKEGEKVTLTSVLMVVDDNGEIHVGKPYVNKASVSAVVKKALQGEKVSILRFRAKSRHTRRQGFREDLTKIYIDSISVDKKIYKQEVKASKESKKPEVKEVNSKEKKKVTVDSKK